jgi:hypothetical protein
MPKNVLLGLALYDPACQAEDGSYWTWRHADLNRQLLEDAFYSAIRHNVPSDERVLRDSELIAGYLKLAENQIYFRVVDGGRDRQNRPGRYVVICAVATASDEPAPSPEEIWRSRAFERLAEAALRKCPVPPPPNLEMGLEASERESNSDELTGQLVRDGKQQWRDASPWTEFMQMCRELPAGDWKATLFLGPQEQTAEISRIASKPVSKPPPPKLAAASNPTKEISPPRRTFKAFPQLNPKARRTLVAVSLGLAVVFLTVMGLLNFGSGEMVAEDPTPAIPGASPSDRVVIKRVSRIVDYGEPLAPGPSEKSLEIQFQLPQELAKIRDQLEGTIEVISEDASAGPASKEKIRATLSLRELLNTGTTVSDIATASFKEWPKDSFRLRINLSSPTVLARKYDSNPCPLP